jgi:hypothetical protein
VLSLNKKALKEVNKILCGFLWVGRNDTKGEHCHVNLDKVVGLLWYGGLGIPNLTRTTIILRVPWLYTMPAYPLRLWRELDM